MEANPRSDERTMNGPKSDQGEVCNFLGTRNVITVKIWGSLENKTAIPGLHPGGPATHSPHPMEQGPSWGLSTNLPATELAWEIPRSKEGRGPEWSSLKHKCGAKTLIPRTSSGSSPNSLCLLGSYGQQGKT